MGGKIDLSKIPEPIAKVYWKAFAAVGNVEDEKVQRALVDFMRAVHAEAKSPEATAIDWLGA